MSHGLKSTRPHSRGLLRLAQAALVAAAVFLVGAAPSAHARSVYLNGINIDGVTNQQFKNCTVQLDAQGNVYITAAGYKVQTVDPAPAAKKPEAAQGGPVSRRYFLVSESNAPGMPQYDIDVFVNSVWIKRITHREAQTVLEITKHMRQGKNIVHFTATKDMTTGRKSASAGHYVKIIVGEGNMGGNNVMIDNALVEYKRTAAEIKNFSHDYDVTGR